MRLKLTAAWFESAITCVKYLALLLACVFVNREAVPVGAQTPVFYLVLGYCLHPTLRAIREAFTKAYPRGPESGA